MAPENNKDQFYDQLQSLIQASPTHDMTIVLTDANATIAADTRDPTLPYVTGPVFIDRTTNDNGHRLVDLCRTTEMSISDTWFPRKRIHHWTWISNDGVTKKAIDHLLISTRWRTFIQNCRVYRGAHLANTDHRMLVATLALKLKSIRANPNSIRHNIAALKNPATQEQFAVSISNRFAALEDLDGEDSDWPTFKEAVTSAASETLGRARAVPKKPWISQETLAIIEERRQARLNNDLATYRRLNGVRNAAIRRD